VRCRVAGVRKGRLAARCFVIWPALLSSRRPLRDKLSCDRAALMIGHGRRGARRSRSRSRSRGRSGFRPRAPRLRAGYGVRPPTLASLASCTEQSSVRAATDEARRRAPARPAEPRVQPEPAAGLAWARSPRRRAPPAAYTVRGGQAAALRAARSLARGPRPRPRARRAVQKRRAGGGGPRRPPRAPSSCRRRVALGRRPKPSDQLGHVHRPGGRRCGVGAGAAAGRGSAPSQGRALGRTSSSGRHPTAPSPAPSPGYPSPPPQIRCGHPHLVYLGRVVLWGGERMRFVVARAGRWGAGRRPAGGVHGARTRIPNLNERAAARFACRAKPRRSACSRSRPTRGPKRRPPVTDTNTHVHAHSHTYKYTCIYITTPCYTHYTNMHIHVNT
jgi:hypothetical protein